VELFHDLLDLPTLLIVVVLGVMHQASGTAFVAFGWLTWELVTARAITSTSRCYRNSGSSNQWLVFFFFFSPLLYAAASGSGLPAFPASGVGC
jgi:hypothetical protein